MSNASEYVVSFREDAAEGSSEWKLRRVRAYSPEAAADQIERDDRLIESVRLARSLDAHIELD